MANDPAGLDGPHCRTGLEGFFSGNEFPSLKCLVCDSISMGNGGKVNGMRWFLNGFGRVH